MGPGGVQTLGSSLRARRAVTAETLPMRRGRGPRRVSRATRRGPCLHRSAELRRRSGHVVACSSRRRSSAFSRNTRSSSESVSATSSRGRETGAVIPTASEYFRYVSIDATTIRASTVTRSMPTSETRTHASITMPLSRTRSRTSMRELPLGERSTAIETYSAGKRVLLLTTSRLSGLRRELLKSAFDALETTLDVARKKRTRRYRRESRVVPPPVQSDLFGFVDGADEQAHLDGEQLDV